MNTITSLAELQAIGKRIEAGSADNDVWADRHMLYDTVLALLKAARCCSDNAPPESKAAAEAALLESLK